MDENGVVEIKDFNFDPKPKLFRLYKNDPVTFKLMPTLPAGTIAEAAKLVNVGQNMRTTGVAPIADFFDKIMLPDSAAEFRNRLLEPSTYPIGVEMLQPIMMWVLEVYGLRPTQPSSDSSTGSTDDGGTSSMAGQPHVESTLSLSPPTDFSTSLSTTSATPSGDS